VSEFGSTPAMYIYEEFDPLNIVTKAVFVISNFGFGVAYNVLEKLKVLTIFGVFGSSIQRYWG